MMIMMKTNPVLVIDDLDYAAMLVLHRGRSHWLFWLHWLGGFLLQLLLRDNMQTRWQIQHTVRGGGIKVSWYYGIPKYLEILKV